VPINIRKKHDALTLFAFLHSYQTHAKEKTGILHGHDLQCFGQRLHKWIYTAKELKLDALRNVQGMVVYPKEFSD